MKTSSEKLISKPKLKKLDNKGGHKIVKAKTTTDLNGKKKIFKPNFKSDSKKPTEPTEKPNWSKFKQEKRSLKIKRKESKDKDLFKLTLESKKLYEKLKCRSTEKRNELAQDLYTMVKRGNCLQKFVLAHDTSRIIQCLLKHLSPKMREELSKELLPISVEMMTSRYANFCIVRMLKYGSNTTKENLIKSLYGSVLKLVSHNIAGKILDLIYFDKATQNQKAFLRQEFYSDLFTKTKDSSVKKLSDTFNVIPSSREFTLDSVKSKLTHVVNKNAMDNSLVHSILLEYIEEAHTGKSADDCNEFMKLCAPLIPLLVTTRDGSKAAIWIYWLSQTKERRAIIKSLKEHLLKIYTHEFGHLFIIAIVNTLDDTKAIKKSLFDPLLVNFDEIITNQWGRKILEWFISPADTECFHPGLIKYIDSGLVYSKKDKDLRRKEIFEQIQDPLCDKFLENHKLWISSGQIGLFTGTFLKQIKSEKSSEVFNVLAKEICSPDWTIGETNEVGIEDSGMHHVLTKIFKHDELKIKNNESSFSFSLLQNIDENTLEFWIVRNRSCFVLVKLFEAVNDEQRQELINLLKPKVNLLKQQTHSGGKILLKKIET